MRLPSGPGGVPQKLPGPGAAPVSLPRPARGRATETGCLMINQIQRLYINTNALPDYASDLRARRNELTTILHCAVMEAAFLDPDAVPRRVKEAEERRRQQVLASMERRRRDLCDMSGRSVRDGVADNRRRRPARPWAKENSP